MQDLCSILNFTLNDLFSGEKIPDDKYKEVADSNLRNALETSAFTLKDRIDYFKKKWEKDHFFELTIIMIIIVFFIIYGFLKDNGVQYLFIILGFISGIVEYNKMMAYIERNAYGKNFNITVEELRNSINRLNESKNLLKQFSSKKEAIDYLVKETNLSRKECSTAYDFIMKTDLSKNIE